MTIAACYFTPEGIVFGADSATTTSAPLGAGASPGMRHFNHAQKIFEVGSNGPLGPIAVATWGLGQIGMTSHRTAVADFATDIESNLPTTMDDVAERWKQHIWALYSTAYAAEMARAQALRALANRTPGEESELRSLANNLVLGYFLGGYRLPDRTPKLYEFNFNTLQTAPPTPNHIQVGTLASSGCPNIILRLIKGYDPQVFEAVKSSGKWSGTDDELLATMDAFQQFPSCFLPIRDAVDLVYSMIYTTIKGLRYSQLPTLCGGPIEIAAITTDRPFRWVVHKGLDVAVRHALYNET